VGSKEDLIRSVNEITSNPVTIGTTSTATAGVGLGTLLGVLENGVAAAAVVMSLLVTVALWRKLRLEQAKLRLENREAELRIKVLEGQLNQGSNIDAPLD